MESLFDIDFHILFRGNFLLHNELKATSFFELCFWLDEFLFLLHCLLHFFVSFKEFTFIILDFLKNCWLLFLFLLCCILLCLKLSHKTCFFFFINFSTCLNLGPLLFESLFNCSLFFLELFFHLGHLCLIYFGNDFLNDDVFSSCYFSLARLSWESQLSTRKLCKLFSKSGKLIMELSNHGILWIFIDSRLVLDLLCTTGIP